MNLYELIMSDTIYYLLTILIITLLALPLYIMSCIFLFKTKQKAWLIGILLASLMLYQCIPWFLEGKAYNHNKIDYIDLAAKFALFPMQKGYIYQRGGTLLCLYNLPQEIKYLEKAHGYLGFDEPTNTLLIESILAYYNYGDFDKVIEIGKNTNASYFVMASYIMKNDFENALLIVDKDLEQNKKKTWLCVYKANILLNLNREEEALLYYNQAVNSANGNKALIKNLTEYYKNKNYVKDKWEKQRIKYLQKGGVL